MSKDLRKARLDEWAREALGRHNISLSDDFRLERASDDASFRRYFRARSGSQSYIFVDAPPDREDSRPFVDVAERLGRYGLNAPRVYEADLELGFMMLSDLGNELYLSAVQDADQSVIDRLYDDAFAGLERMQEIPVEGLPPYNETLLREEMNLLPDWFLDRQLAITIDESESQLLEQVFRLMVDNANEQPVVFVHRDYHSRNLMVTERDNPGILDFQDAVAGPLTYDLVSLLRDCYLRFPREQVYDWVESFRNRLVASAQLNPSVSASTFRRWFDLMGLQRHIKVAGIFSRLNIRDGKPRYLSDIPLVVGYMREVSGEYPELMPFAEWIDDRILRAMKDRPEFMTP
ncbi:MAG: phosphotransferase [Pseudomonadales bacterium]|nr:phosphotransferase [Pseudomonadales bacterium]